MGGEKILFHRLIRASDYRGSDARFDSGQLCGPAAWRRRSIDVGRWVWYEIVAHEYVRPEHMNALEIRSATKPRTNQQESNPASRNEYVENQK